MNTQTENNQDKGKGLLYDMMRPESPGNSHHNIHQAYGAHS